MLDGDLLAVRPERKLLDLEPQLVRVITDELDQQAAGISVGLRVELRELLGHPRHELRALGLEQEHLGCAGKRRAFLCLFSDECQHGVGRGRFRVGRDGLDVGRLPTSSQPTLFVPVAVDLRHDHEPATRREQAQRVAGRHGLLAGRVRRRQVLGPRWVEVSPEPLEGPLYLGPVGAGDQVNGLQVRHCSSLVLGRDAEPAPVGLDRDCPVAIGPVDGQTGSGIQRGQRL